MNARYPEAGRQRAQSRLPAPPYLHEVVVRSIKIFVQFNNQTLKKRRKLPFLLAELYDQEKQKSLGLHTSACVLRFPLSLALSLSLVPIRITNVINYSSSPSDKRLFPQQVGLTTWSLRVPSSPDHSVVLRLLYTFYLNSLGFWWMPISVWFIRWQQISQINHTLSGSISFYILPFHLIIHIHWLLHSSYCQLNTGSSIIV